MLINKEIFNVGLDNYKIKNLAYLVREQLPIDIEIDLAPDDADKRNYSVNFEKIQKTIRKPKEDELKLRFPDLQDLFVPIKTIKEQLGI